jgi:hypothetical protein
MSNDDRDGTSGSGDPVMRHVRRKGFEGVGEVDDEGIELVCRAMDRYVGPADSVFHELVSDLVHIDVHVVTPRPGRDFYTLYTTGMSDRPMKVPADAPMPAYLELMLALPKTWRLDEASLEDERNYWPIRLLKVLARLPHEYDTWLGPFHTIPNGDPAVPYAEGTQLSGAMITYPCLLDADFEPIAVRADKAVYVLAVTPLHPLEMELKLAKGGEALDERLEAAGVTELIDPTRKPVRRKKLFGLF